jgi:hypothetical protein
MNDDGTIFFKVSCRAHLVTFSVMIEKRKVDELGNKSVPLLSRLRRTRNKRDSSSWIAIFLMHTSSRIKTIFFHMEILTKTHYIDSSFYIMKWNAKTSHSCIPYCGPATYADIFIELSIFMSDSDPFLSYMLRKQKKKRYKRMNLIREWYVNNIIQNSRYLIYFPFQHGV